MPLTLRFASLPVFGSLLVSVFAAAASAQAPAAPQSDAAAELNTVFRGSYAAARAEVLAAAKPVILYDGEKLVLVADGKREAGTLVPVKYHRLKAIAHLPFTLYLELRTPTRRAAEESRAFWTRLGKLVDDVERELPTYDFTPDELTRQQAIVAASKPIIAAALAGSFPTPGQLLAFTRKMGPLQEANAVAAAAIELDHYRVQAEAWRKTLGAAAWNDVTVVVAGSQMPRKRHRVVQFFSAMLGVAGEGPRIIYAEALYDPDKALNLFGTHKLDAESAAAFFDDPARLDEDLLSRGAAEYVRRQFPQAAR